MLIDRLVRNGWPAIALCEMLYVSDYYLTIASARRLMRNPHVVYPSGFELTPQYRDDVRNLRSLSPVFWRNAAVLAGLLACAWLVLIRARAVGDVVGAAFFQLLLGAYLLSEVAVHERHLGNLDIAADLVRSRGVRGRLVQRMGYSRRASAANLLLVSLTFAVCWALTGRALFAGGLLRCLSMARDHQRMARQESSKTV